MKGSFSKEEFIDWQLEVADMLSVIAAIARKKGTKGDYVATMAFGVGAMTVMSIVRKSLESGKAMGKFEMAAIFADSLDDFEKNKGVIDGMYDMEKKED